MELMAARLRGVPDMLTRVARARGVIQAKVSIGVGQATLNAWSRQLQPIPGERLLRDGPGGGAVPCRPKRLSDRT
jgi:hypothetical protein